MSERHDFDLTATIVRGQAPARAVTVQRAVAFSGRLTHQLDYVVFLHVLFAINSGMQVTVPGVVQSIREAGVRSAKNGNELVGRDAVYESFARLIEARFIRRTTIPNPKGKGYRGLTSYEVFEHFEDNPDYAPEAPSEEPETKLPVFAETTVSAGQTTSGVRGNKGSSGVRGSGVRGRGGAFISAGQPTSANSGSGTGSPPHPPEEVTTSSPNPLTNTTGLEPAAPEEEGRVFDSGATEAAARFLQMLPPPWSVGRVKAKAIAPVLLEAMADQGWPKLADLDARSRRLLVEQLTKNPDGVKNYGYLLERDRVPNLPLFEIVACASVPAQGSGGGRPPRMPEADPDYKPVPAPPEIAAILKGLRKPNV
ncbi:hypothetical protein ACFQ7J_14235 [Streptomyces sp. NPDC056501]|uniref:hypothetical protein n=1 Tax=Streptomyces sp. NPDC056501 TaxID=3345841 RepID=UPI0036ADAEB0